MIPINGLDGFQRMIKFGRVAIDHFIIKTLQTQDPASFLEWVHAEIFFMHHLHEFGVYTDKNLSIHF